MLLENMKLALTAIRANKMRSLLTMLGIIIGISSVISIVSIGESMRAMMADQFQSIGVNRIMIYVSDWENQRESDNHTIDQMEKLQAVFPDQIDYIDPAAGASGESINGRNKMKVSYTGVSDGFENVQPTNIIYGRMINEGDVKSARYNAVLEEKTAIELFGTANAVGQRFRTTLQGDTGDYTVVGVYRKESSPMDALMSMGSAETGLAYIPYSVLVGPSSTFFYFNIYLAEGVDQAQFNPTISDYIAKMKNREAEFITCESAKDQMGAIDSVMSILSLAIGAIAAISLLVGGIGIMNIMLVSVTERTREIGIRKALGARTKDVLVQFLTESALISAAGGIVGVVLGVGLVAGLGAIFGMSAVINPVVVVSAVIFSALVGVFFGIYPAQKAAKADPIVALRYE